MIPKELKKSIQSGIYDDDLSKLERLVAIRRTHMFQNGDSVNVARRGIGVIVKVRARTALIQLGSGLFNDPRFAKSSNISVRLNELVLLERKVVC